MRALLLAALFAGLAGCSLTIDPDKVPAPTPRPSACVSTGCSAVACGGVDNCGNACNPGSGCVSTHSLQGALGLGADNASVTGGHAVQRGTVSQGAGSASAGHSIVRGSVSP